MSLTLEQNATIASLPKTPLPKASGVYGNSSERFHWTVESYYRAINADVFEEPQQWELINGEVVNRENMNPPHAFVADELSSQLREKLGDRFLVREEKPIRIAFDGEPTPDIVVVRGKRSDYVERHPTPEDVRLLIEVADTTEAKDTGYKASLYSEAGIGEYWVVLVNKRQVNVYRNPTETGYDELLERTETDTLSPQIAPDVVIAVSELLPPVVEELVQE